MPENHEEQSQISQELQEQLAAAREKMAKGEVDANVMAMVKALKDMLHGN